MSMDNRRVMRSAILLGSLAMGVQDFPQQAALGPSALPYTPALPIALAHGLLQGVGVVDPSALFTLTLALWMAAVPLFMCLVYCGLRSHAPWQGRALYAALAAQSLLGIVFCDDWLLFVAAELAMLFPRQLGLRLLLGQISAYALVRFTHTLLVAHDLHLACGAGGHFIALTPAQRVLDHGLEIARESVFQLVAFGVGLLAAAERRRKIALSLTNAQTVAVQQLLRDTTQAQERLRLAREMHDSLGHQLTAISLHLDIASRKAGDTASSPLAQARQRAQQLLANVRHLVGVERSRRGGGLAQAVQLLCDSIATVRVHASVSPQLDSVSADESRAVIASLRELLHAALVQTHDVAILISLTPSDSGMLITVLPTHTTNANEMPLSPVIPRQTHLLLAGGAA